MIHLFNKEARTAAKLSRIDRPERLGAKVFWLSAMQSVLLTLRYGMVGGLVMSVPGGILILSIAEKRKMIDRVMEHAGHNPRAGL
ncbi:MAG: hypothetical protein ACXABY_20115 [Candidatus Thorarchaeota archaeon]